VLRRTITPETAAELTSMMESVVERGTAMAAKIDGFTIAGKTGTSAKLVNGVYSKSDYMSSFVGFLPSRNPVVTILVVIDTPRGAYYGGVVAAPLFKRVAEIAMRHLSVPPTVNPAPAVLVKHEASEPAERPVSLPVGTPEVVPVHYGADQMPDLLGLSARNALSVLVRKGVTPRVHGSGVVVEQKPEPGTKLDETRRVELRLGRPPRAVPTQARHAGTGPAGSMRAAP
jgi:membrane peptidoglycan carboxypeptidase